MSPTLVSQPRIRIARQLRHGMTDGEHRLWSELKQFRKLYGVPIRRQVPIGPYVTDFAIHSHRLVIELDGEHHQTRDQKIEDTRRDQWLQSAGYKVLRIHTGELESNFEGCIEEILAKIGKR